MSLSPDGQFGLDGLHFLNSSCVPPCIFNSSCDRSTSDHISINIGYAAFIRVRSNTKRNAEPPLKT